MYKTLRLNDPNVNIFFTSDWHAYHNPKWPVPLHKKRGYDSVSQMNADIINKANSRIREKDYIINLGDGFLNCNKDQIDGFLDSLVCQNIIYLFGNHESVTSRIYKDACLALTGSKAQEVYPVKYKNLHFYGQTLNLVVMKKKFICSHFAMRIWNQSHHGSMSLSGHSHYSDKERHANYFKSKSLDVGWEGKNDFWSFDELMAVMKNKGITQFDHHDEDVN